jgi:chromosome partitioning protein
MPRKIIVVANNKGGTGKTTIAAIIAQTAIEGGTPVVILDLDHAQRDFTAAMSAYECEILGKVSELNQAREAGNGLIVVDTPPSLLEDKDKAMNLADIILIPVSHTIRALEGVKAIVAAHPDTARIVLNLNDPRSALETKIIETASSHFKVLCTLKQSGRIRINLTTGVSWYSGLMPAQKMQYGKLFKGVVDFLKGEGK